MRRGAGFVLLLGLSAAGLFAQTPPLNPTVKVMPRPATPVPPECEEGFAPQPAPRVRIEDVPAPQAVQRDLQPPRTADLREQLAQLQTAVERNDRAAFAQWLAIAKSTLASYPPGAEKTSAQSAIAVYDDIERLWDYQFASPTGSFFDGTVQEGSLVERMRRYPGYEEFIRDFTIVDANGTRIYPTRETRDFLAQIAAGRRPAPVRTARIVMPEPAPRPAPAPAPVTEAPRTTPRRRPSRIELHTRKTETTPGAARTEAPKPKPARRNVARPAPVTTAPPKVAEAKPKPVPAPPAPTSATPDELPIPSGVVSAPTSTETTATTETTASAPSVTEPAPTTAASSEPASRPSAPKPDSKRSLIFPVVLIVIGVGVLYLLFRASA